MTSNQILKDSNLVQTGGDKPTNGSKPEGHFVDPRSQFEAWIDEVKPVSPAPDDHAPPDFIIECDSLSQCDIQFEGVLRLNGFLDGNIHSPGGTLITGPGIVNANIEVATAIIGSFGSVNILATNRVLLQGKISVAGNIRSTALSIKDGAIFNGDCSFVESLAREPVATDLAPGEATPRTLAASAQATDSFSGLPATEESAARN